MPEKQNENDEFVRIWNYLKNFKGVNNGEKTRTDFVDIDGKRIKRFSNEFWTAKQRQGHSIHEVTYRACFKPELPRFFIDLLSKPRDVVYDPFSGRGTTVIEAALLNRKIISNDLHPLCNVLCKPRFFIPDT